jgi:muconolactone D-isomerase
MLFQVEMDVRLPHDFPAEKVEALKQTERARAQELQRAGIWRHLWRVAGRDSNVSIFDVSGPQDLHDILSVCRSFRSWTCGSLRSVVTLHLSMTMIDRFRIN